jgi:hypothetical protein
VAEHAREKAAPITEEDGILDKVEVEGPYS